jgi:hypothetical protein
MRDSVDKPRTHGNPPREMQPPLARHIADLKNWVVWKWKRNTSKWTKPPYIATTPRVKAKNNDPTTWRSFEQACITVEKGLADGIGFNLLGTSIAAFDIDHCRNPETGEIHPFAADLVRRAASYVEVTPSGTGLRIIGTAGQRELNRRLAAVDSVSVELFRNCKRYITISNLPLPDVTTELNEIDALLDTVLAELELKKPADEDRADPFTEHAQSIRPDSPWRDLNDAALANLSAWVPALFPHLKLKRRDNGGYRISSEMLGRNLEEDLAITPNGIVDFGVADMGDEREGKRTPIDLVIEHSGKDFDEATAWLRERLGISDAAPDAAAPKTGITRDSFVAYMPLHCYIYIPTRDLGLPAVLTRG